MRYRLQRDQFNTEYELAEYGSALILDAVRAMPYQYELLIRGSRDGRRTQSHLCERPLHAARGQRRRGKRATWRRPARGDGAHRERGRRCRRHGRAGTGWYEESLDLRAITDALRGVGAPAAARYEEWLDLRAITDALRGVGAPTLSTYAHLIARLAVPTDPVMGAATPGRGEYRRVV